MRLGCHALSCGPQSGAGLRGICVSRCDFVVGIMAARLPGLSGGTRGRVGSFSLGCGGLPAWPTQSFQLRSAPLNLLERFSNTATMTTSQWLTQTFWEFYFTVRGHIQGDFIFTPWRMALACEFCGGGCIIRCEVSYGFRLYFHAHVAGAALWGGSEGGVAFPSKPHHPCPRENSPSTTHTHKHTNAHP